MILTKELIVIVGCSGRTGTRVAHKFADPRFMVVGLDTISPKISTTNFEFIQCDVTVESELKTVMDRIRQKYGNRISSLIHLVSCFSPEANMWPMYEKVIVTGTSNLIKAIEGFQIEQIIYGSTLLVYAPCESGQRMTEHWPLRPTWDLPKAKLQAEELLQNAHGKTPLVILRRAIGYDDLCHALPLSHQIQRIYERAAISIFFPGNLTHGMAYIHYDDVADAIWLTVQRRFGLPNSVAFILAEPDTVSYGELEKVIGLLAYGEECKTWAIPKWLARSYIRYSEKFSFFPKVQIKEWMVDLCDQNYSCDTNMIQERLGWAQKHSLRQTLPKMIHSLKENPLNWYRENGLKLPEKK